MGLRPLACLDCGFARFKAWFCGPLPIEIVGSRGLRRGPAAARLLRLWVRIPHGTWMSVVIVVSSGVEVSATSRSPVQRISIECGVSECDLNPR